MSHERGRGGSWIDKAMLVVGLGIAGVGGWSVYADAPSDAKKEALVEVQQGSITTEQAIDQVADAGNNSMLDGGIMIGGASMAVFAVATLLKARDNS